MHDPYWPVPFALDDVPASLHGPLTAAAADGLTCDDAILAIREHWQDGGARTPALVLAMAYLQVKLAGEIMVDDQLDAAIEGLKAVAWAEGAGVPATPGLRRFATLCRDIHSEEQARQNEALSWASADPATLDRDTAVQVAYALSADRPAEAVSFFTRVIELEPRNPLHYRWNRASCQLRSGDEGAAMAFFDEVLAHRLDADAHIVSSAWCRRLERTEDARFPTVFAQAVAWGASRGKRFPLMHGDQEALLERALELDDREALRQLVAVLDERGSRLERPVQARVDEARARVSAPERPG